MSICSCAPCHWLGASRRSHSNRVMTSGRARAEFTLGPMRWTCSASGALGAAASPRRAPQLTPRAERTPVLRMRSLAVGMMAILSLASADLPAQVVASPDRADGWAPVPFAVGERLDYNVKFG